MNKIEIEKAAMSVYAKYFKKGKPYDKIHKIMKEEGIVYKEIEADPNEFLGVLIKSPKGTPCIVINKNIENIGRKNFTIAHELGHFVLGHLKQNVSFICRERDIFDSSNTKSIQEREANYFASCFLMQRQRVINEFTRRFRYHLPEVYDKNKRAFLYINIQSKQNLHYWIKIESVLTKEFGVSTEALKIRLIDLGLMNNF